MSLVLRRAAIFLAVIVAGALLAAAVAHSATRDRDVVAFSGFAPGTIVVKTGARRLYYVIDEQRALRFPVGVGRDGKSWTGTARVEGKYMRPAWSPPDEIRRDHPDLPQVITGGGEYAIHGTNRPASIGGFVSYGCIRMHNRDIVELFSLVDIGTPVIVER